jgi:glycerol-3-phosphate acyltransferase PlsY
MPGLDVSLPIALLALALGYLLGSIPFGIVLTRLTGAGDLRQIGSGNIGATNVLRTGKRWLAAATLAGDILKGTAAVLIAGQFGIGAAILAGFAAFFGHLYPVWLGFRGGKGVATYLGVLIGLAFPGALAFAAIWLAVAFVTKYSSLSALIAAAALPFLLWALGYGPVAALFAILSLVLILKHHENIRRLLAGTEGRINLSKRA